MKPKKINFNKTAKLKEFLDQYFSSMSFNINYYSLKTQDFNMNRPSVRSPISGMIYLANPNLEHMYLPNLEKTLE